MTPREACLIHAAAVLMAAKYHAGYGPAHAVKDALEIEKEVKRQHELEIHDQVFHPSKIRQAGGA